MKSPALRWLIFGLLILPQFVHGQKNIQDSTISLPWVSLGYVGSGPGGDLDDRFGFTSSLMIEAGVKLKNNFYLVSGVEFLFGNRLNEPIAQGVTSLNGTPETGYRQQAIGADGLWYDIRMYERGYIIPLRVGKVFPIVRTHNKNSGIFIEAGAQFIQHKVRIEVVGDNVPALANEFIPGYDRLTNGIGLTEAIGYRYFSDRKLINFQLGIQLSQSFTQSRRDWNYDLGRKDETKRLDLLNGFRVGWVFPIYQSVDTRAHY